MNISKISPDVLDWILIFFAWVDMGLVYLFFYVLNDRLTGLFMIISGICFYIPVLLKIVGKKDVRP